MRIWLVAAVAAVLPSPAVSQTYANPVDLDYRYGFDPEDLDKTHRSGADPVIVRHGDAYYLFLTMADGYWRSTDLVTWRFMMMETCVPRDAALRSGIVRLMMFVLRL